jgi:G3E family GTPase
MKSLYIVTGFLGAGKTTFLKNLFEVFKDKKTAIIVNEFGQTGVDGAILAKSGMVVSEITNGSIFCVCRSDLFMDALKKAHETDAEIIVVETSGLSDPLSSDSILEQLKSVYACEFEFRGIITIIDAKNFKRVIKTAVNVRNQVISADLFIINKTDLVQESDILLLEKELTLLNPFSKIIKTTFGKIDEKDCIINLTHSPKEGALTKKDLVSQRMLLEFDGEKNFDETKNFIDEFKDFAYRIKGYIKTEQGCFFVEAVMGDITYEKIGDYSDKSFLVVLYNSTIVDKKRVMELFENLK